MSNRSAVTPMPLMVAALVLLVAAAGLFAALRVDSWGENGLPEEFDYDVQSFQKTDPALIGYQETGRIALEMQEPRALAVGPDDAMYVAGDQALSVFSAEGSKSRDIPLRIAPRCLAVADAKQSHPGLIYVGASDHVEVLNPDGSREATWNSEGEKALFTSIALGDGEIYAADAGNRRVVRYDPAGAVLGRITGRDEECHTPGFIIPSPYFDLAIAQDGLLRVVNPGCHRIEVFTSEGGMESKWGRPSMAIDGFCGCCNPANIAILPDGRVATAEKGIPRVKVYSAEGQFVCVVVGPEVLMPTPTMTEETRTRHKLKVIDVAADSRGRILVLDPVARCVRVFEAIAAPSPAAKDASPAKAT